MPIVSVNSIVVNPKDLGNIPIKPEENVYLRDLGTVEDTTDIPTGWALVNGRRAVYMPILKTADASTLTVATQLQEQHGRHAERPAQGLQAGTGVRSVALRHRRGRRRGAGVGHRGPLDRPDGAACSCGDWRSVVVVVLTIPLSLMGALIGLFITGQSINLMTLGGMSLAVGILVDMGTVVIENIHTQMAKQPSLARAVFVGTAETTVPILLAMLCILAVFLPSFLMEGAAGSLFVPLAISVGFAMITAFIAVDHVRAGAVDLDVEGARPRARRGDASSAGGSRSPASGAATSRSYAAYWPHAGWCWAATWSSRRWCSGVCGLQVGQEISPQVDAGQFQMRLKAPVGTRLEVTEDLTRQALEEIKNILGPDSVKISVAHIGQTAPTFTANAVFLWTSGPDQAVIRIALNEEKELRTEEVKERLRKELPERLQPWLAERLQAYGVSAGRSPQVAPSKSPSRSSRPT